MRLSRTTTAKKLELPQAFFASSPHNFTATRNLCPVFPCSKPDPFYQPIFKANFCYIRSSHSQPLLCALRVRALGCTWFFLAFRTEFVSYSLNYTRAAKCQCNWNFINKESEKYISPTPQSYSLLYIHSIKRVQRIMGPCACTGYYGITSLFYLFLPGTGFFYTFKSSSKQK